MLVGVAAAVLFWMSWNCPPLAPTFAGGHAKPVTESVPVKSCQQPFGQQSQGVPSTSGPSKPDQKSRLPGGVVFVGGGGVPPVVPDGVTTIASKPKYCASDTTVSTCLPAARLTPCLPTNWNVAQLPVFGTLMVPVTLTPSTSMWKAGVALA